MAELVTSGLIADIALAALAIEAAAILWLTRLRPRWRALAGVAPFLIAGACLIVALKAALEGWSWPWIAAALTASGVAHAVDLVRRFRR